MVQIALSNDSPHNASQENSVTLETLQVIIDAETRNNFLYHHNGPSRPAHVDSDQAQS
jgi:hypothetical protein